MYLLVSTPVHILLVEPFLREVTLLRTVDGYYYGITHKNGTIVLTHTAGYLEYFNRGFGSIQTIDHLIQPHQAEWVEDQVLVANTGHNCISIFDSSGNLCRDVYLNEIKKDDKYRGQRGNHFNSVHRIGDRVFVIAHNYEKPSEVYELSWPELEIVGVKTTRAMGAHNLWVGEWGMVICDSENGGLYNVDSGEIFWQSKEDGVMTRGLAVSPEYIFIGCSRHFSRAHRYWSTGGLWIMDRKTLKTVEKINFPGSGDVHEIRIIGMLDECHNEEIIPLEILPSLRKASAVVDFAYWVRKTFPLFRRNVLPLSFVVKSAKMTVRWKRSIKRVLTR
ncbi:MAG: hypothetical protein AB1894_21730 [Chloroflexota bacterium]